MVLIIVVIGFVLFLISMTVFNNKRLKKTKSFPYDSNKKPSIDLAGFEYFIFIKFDKELTKYAILAWIGLLLFLVGNLINPG